MQKMDGNQDKKRTNKWKREFVHVTSCMTADNNENVQSFVKRVILLAVFNRKSVFCSNTISKQEVNLSNEICKTIPILVEIDFIVHIFFRMLLL